jgi:hypothetical protein
MVAAPLGGWLTGPAGTVSLGPLTVSADMGIACAVITDLLEGIGLTTSEMVCARCGRSGLVDVVVAPGCSRPGHRSRWPR